MKLHLKFPYQSNIEILVAGLLKYYPKIYGKHIRRADKARGWQVSHNQQIIARAVILFL